MTDQVVTAPRDRDPVNTAVSAALALGSLVAAAVLAMGFAAWLVTGARPSEQLDALGWLGRLGRLDAGAIMFAGLVLVTLIPVAQLVAGLGAFVRERDWRHAGVAAGVLGVVLGSAAIALLIGGTR